MKWLKWIIAVSAFLVMLYFTALPGNLVTNDGGDQDRLTGTYSVNGVGPTGVEYTGVFVIAPLTEDGTYPVQWIVTGAIDAGSGTLDGEILTVDWASVTTSGPPLSGHALYTVQDDGRLVGERWVDGIERPSTEEVFPEA